MSTFDNPPVGAWPVAHASLVHFDNARRLLMAAKAEIDTAGDLRATVPGSGVVRVAWVCEAKLMEAIDAIAAKLPRGPRTDTGRLDGCALGSAEDSL